MKIVTNDVNGIGQEVGSFVYIRIDEDGCTDCGIRLVHGDYDKPHFLCENSLIDTYKEEVVFNFTGRNPLDEETEHLVGILTKDELKAMILSLTDIWLQME